MEEDSECPHCKESVEINEMTYSKETGNTCYGFICFNCMTEWEEEHTPNDIITNILWEPEDG